MSKNATAIIDALNAAGCAASFQRDDDGVERLHVLAPSGRLAKCTVDGSKIHCEIEPAAGGLKRILDTDSASAVVRWIEE